MLNVAFLAIKENNLQVTLGNEIQVAYFLTLAYEYCPVVKNVFFQCREERSDKYFGGVPENGGLH